MVKTLTSGPSRLWYDTVDPGLSETSVDVFNWWLNTSSGKFFICLDNTLGAQAWEECVVQNENILTGNITLASGSAVRTSTGAGNTVLFQAYDTDTGPAYTTFATLTAGTSPTFTLAPTSITFSGETVFNHYFEQQAWTPVVTGGTVAGTGTYTTQAGYYTRVGNMIFLQASITWSAHTGTGDMTVTGLPFSARNSSNYNPEGIVNPSGIPLPGAATSARTHLLAGTTTLPLFVLRSNNTNDPIQMNGTGDLHITITYLT